MFNVFLIILIYENGMHVCFYLTKCIDMHTQDIVVLRLVHINTKIQSSVCIQFVYTDQCEQKRQTGWVKMQIHSMTVVSAYRKAEIH